MLKIVLHDLQVFIVRDAPKPVRFVGTIISEDGDRIIFESRVGNFVTNDLREGIESLPYFSHFQRDLERAGFGIVGHWPMQLSIPCTTERKI